MKMLWSKVDKPYVWRRNRGMWVGYTVFAAGVLQFLDRLERLWKRMRRAPQESDDHGR